MTDKTTAPGGTYGTADPAEPARRDKLRKDQHLGPGPDPSYRHEAHDEGLVGVEDDRPKQPREG
jgi:hypothetical protein